MSKSVQEKSSEKLISCCRHGFVACEECCFNVEILKSAKEHLNNPIPEELLGKEETKK